MCLLSLHTILASHRLVVPTNRVRWTSVGVCVWVCSSVLAGCKTAPREVTKGRKYCKYSFLRRCFFLLPMMRELLSVSKTRHACESIHAQPMQSATLLQFVLLRVCCAFAFVLFCANYAKTMVHFSRPPNSLRLHQSLHACTCSHLNRIAMSSHCQCTRTNTPLTTV